MLIVGIKSNSSLIPIRFIIVGNRFLRFGGHIKGMTDHPALRRAHHCLSQADRPGALDALNQALADEPNQRDLLRLRIQLHLAAGRDQEAERDLSHLLSVYADDAESWDDKGVLLQKRGAFAAAANCHLQAAELKMHDGYVLNLAIALTQLGQRQEAEALYLDTLTLNPGNTRALINLGILYDERGAYHDARNVLQMAVDRGDQSFELCMAYGNACRHLSQQDAAHWYEKALQQKPDHPSAQYMLAIARGESPDAPPTAHIANLFDSYANHFEQSLVDQLKYRAPELLFTALKPFLDGLVTQGNGIDLGAGTGLFGVLLRPYLKNSIGLDLSPLMLEKAQEKKTYDDVLCMDMEKGLGQYPDEFFAIVSAADVFVYAGALDKLFAQARRTLKQGGLFAFTAEAMTENETGQFIARETGRYAHSDAYLKELARQNVFKAAVFQRDWLRYNKDQPLDGFVVVLQKA